MFRVFTHGNTWPPVFLLLALPLLVPSYAVGSGLTEWFIRLGLDGTILALVAAHLTFVLPYVVIVLLAGFGPRLTAIEEMGSVSGLTPLRRAAAVGMAFSGMLARMVRHVKCPAGQPDRHSPNDTQPGHNATRQ